MDLKNLIRPQLWNEVSNAYVAENYKNSILDAMRYLSKVIREKSGLDGDGTALVSQAFGGDAPKLRINKLQTQSEKDEQRGFQQIITGLYTAIRNPRTHEEIQDNVNVADPIIYFINHVLSVIDVARPPFAIEEFIPRVYDKDFVERKDYADELVNEIPINKRLEVLIEIYRQKSKGEGKKLKLISRAIVENLTESEISEFVKIVSEELDVVSDENVIITTLQILPTHLWQRVKKTARMRIENKLIVSIRSGDAIVNQNKIRSGAFGTWATSLIDNFSLKNELASALFSRVYSSDPGNALYVFKFFLSYLPGLSRGDSDMEAVVSAMHELVEKGDKNIKSMIVEFSSDAPDEWFELIKEKFADFTDTEKPEYYLKDGTPFLGKVPEHVASEDDFPF